jgi:hypothetical protein
MLASTFVAILTFAASTASAAVAASGCTAEQRINFAQMIPNAYAQSGVVAVKEAFSKIPFGVPDLDGPCTTVM